MNEDHQRLLGEFRVLADTVLAGLEPILQKAAASSVSEPSENAAVGESAEAPAAFSGCSWCPVCALAALARGEQHELLAFLAGQAAAFLALLRELLDEFLGDHAPPRSTASNGAFSAGDSGTGPERPRAATFTPIDVTVKV